MGLNAQLRRVRRDIARTEDILARPGLMEKDKAFQKMRRGVLLGSLRDGVARRRAIRKAKQAG